MDKFRKSKNVNIYAGVQPPQNKAAEEAVLGACLLVPRAIVAAMQYLEDIHFYVETHQTIFRTMVWMERKGMSIDLVTVTNQLVTNDQLSQLPDGAYYLVQLTHKVASDSHIRQHCLVILEKYILREQLKLGYEVINKVNDGGDFFEINKYLITRREEMWSNYEKVKRQSYEQIVFKRTEEILSNDGTKPHGLLTLFPSIDNIIVALIPQLIVIAARPSMGKTAFMVQLTEHMERQGPVGLIELESSTNAYVDRHLANVSSLNATDLKRGGLTDEQKTILSTASSEIMSKKIYCDFNSLLDHHDIIHTVGMWVEQYGVKTILLDYLQIMQVSDEEERLSRERQVSKQAQLLAAAAVKYNVLVIAFAQLSREVLKRADKRPNLGDLRESGGIEAAARQVWFIHRPEYYIEPGKEKVDEFGNDLTGVTEIIVAKNNEGDTGVARLRFDKYRSKFTDMGEDYWFTTNGTEQRPPMRPTIEVNGRPINWRRIPWEKDDTEEAPF
jgi:replicative DNA helicase